MFKEYNAFLNNESQTLESLVIANFSLISSSSKKFHWWLVSKQSLAPTEAASCVLKPNYDTS